MKVQGQMDGMNTSEDKNYVFIWIVLLSLKLIFLKMCPGIPKIMLVFFPLLRGMCSELSDLGSHNHILWVKFPCPTLLRYLFTKKVGSVTSTGWYCLPNRYFSMINNIAINLDSFKCCQILSTFQHWKRGNILTFITSDQRCENN